MKNKYSINNKNKIAWVIDFNNSINALTYIYNKLIYKTQLQY